MTYKPALRWPGGKTRLAPKILPLIPRHTCYAEAFAGGLGLLCAKEPSPVEVINDANKDLVNFYKNVQEHPREILRQIQYVQNSRSTLFEFIEQSGLTELQKAARWFIRNRISFNGGMTSFAVSKSKGGGCGSRSQRMALIDQLNERLQGVTIENKSYEDLMETYDGKETFFFLDPPYSTGDTKNYSGWTDKEMHRLCRRINRLKGTFILTVNDSPANREIFSDFKIQPVTSRNGATNNRTHSAATFGELIITA